jgi:V8-like Glu-specific endopeptidase
MALVVVALVTPTVAAADATASEEEAVLEPAVTSPAQALAFWTQTRREQAEPLPIVTLPGSTPAADGESVEQAATDGGATPAAAEAPRARAAGVGGNEVKSTESTVFPNSANGKVLGVFNLFPPEGFECSGSVITGSVVLTAGHCVIDPETGKHALAVVFAPGYNNGSTSKPYGEWLAVATDYAFTKSWEQTAKPGSYPNEGSDVAFLRMTGDLERAVGGSLKIAFDQPCNQIYTQYGYPGEAPYDGEVLYSHTTPYAGPDANPAFSPTPMMIASDFTQGASGGPWTIGSASSLTALSVTAYGYENQPGYLYGPYFGEAARKAYELAAGRPVPVGIEEACKPLPEIPPASPPASTPPPAPTPQPEPAPVTTPVRLKVTRVRSRANGSAVLTAKVSAAGMLKLSGTAVRAESIAAPTAGKYRMVVAPKGATNRRLHKVGRAKVRIKVAFKASGRTKRVKRKIQLRRRPGAIPSHRRASHSR